MIMRCIYIVHVIISNDINIIVIGMTRHCRGGHCIYNCTPMATCNRGQSEVKRSRRNFEAGQVVKLGIGVSLRTVKISPDDRWVW